MARIRIHDSTPIEVLATEYVLLTHAQYSSLQDVLNDSFELISFELMQRMLGRCGEEHTLAHIARAREAYRLLTGE